MVKTRENRQILPRGPLNLTLMAIFVINRQFRSRKMVLEKYHIPYISELDLICCGVGRKYAHYRLHMAYFFRKVSLRGLYRFETLMF